MRIDLASEPDFTLATLRVLPSSCEIMSEAGTERLQPRVMQALVALAREQGQVVSRDRLLELAWNGVIVGDDAITRVIGALRRTGERLAPGVIEFEAIPKLGYRLIAPGAENRNTKQAPDLLIAVLPFENLSADPDLAFFSNGLSEEILHTLARGTSLTVIGRNSSFQFTGERKSPDIVRRELNATHVLDGTVQREGTRVRITAQLVSTNDRTLRWSDTIDAELSGIFALQDSIAEGVATALNRTFARDRRPAEVDPDGYEMLLRGSELCRDIDPGSQRKAVALLEAASRSIPELPSVWGELALALAQRRFLRFDRDSDAGDIAAIEAASARARALDPYQRMATVASYLVRPMFDLHAHAREFEVPRRSWADTIASADVSTGVQLLELGAVDEALEFFRQAERLDPVFQIQIFYHCHALACAGETDAALDRLLNAVERWPHIPAFGAAAIQWAAELGRWRDVELLCDPERLAHFPLRHHQPSVEARLRSVREGDASAECFQQMRAAELAIGSSAFEPILMHARHVGLAATLGLIGDEPIVNFEAPRRPDDRGNVALYMPFYQQVRRDPDLPALCTRLGLASAWIETGRWPTFVDAEPGGAAFRKACLALHGQKQAISALAVDERNPPSTADARAHDRD